MSHPDTPTLVSALAAEQLTGAPASWLTGEAAAGRLPHLRAGDRYLFAPQLLARELLRRARDRRPATERVGDESARARRSSRKEALHAQP